jgi:hypothetical protein
MALVYLVRNVDTTTNPVPKHFGKSWATHAIGHERPEVPTAAHELARIFNVKTERDSARDDFARGRI